MKGVQGERGRDTLEEPPWHRCGHGGHGQGHGGGSTAGAQRSCKYCIAQSLPRVKTKPRARRKASSQKTDQRVLLEEDTAAADAAIGAAAPLRGRGSLGPRGGGPWGKARDEVMAVGQSRRSLRGPQRRAGGRWGVPGGGNASARTRGNPGDDGRRCQRCQRCQRRVTALRVRQPRPGMQGCFGAAGRCSPTGPQPPLPLTFQPAAPGPGSALRRSSRRVMAWGCPTGSGWGLAGRKGAEEPIPRQGQRRGQIQSRARSTSGRHGLQGCDGSAEPRAGATSAGEEAAVRARRSAAPPKPAPVLTVGVPATSGLRIWHLRHRLWR